MWELDTLQYDAITVCFPSRDTTQLNSLVSLKPNSNRHLIMLRKYIHHLVQDSHLSVSSDATDHAFVGSPQVSFLMCTLEIPQNLQYKFFALNFVYLYF